MKLEEVIIFDKDVDSSLTLIHLVVASSDDPDAVVKQKSLRTVSTYLCSWIEESISTMLEATKLQGNSFFPPISPMFRKNYSSQSTLNIFQSVKHSDVQSMFSSSREFEASDASILNKKVTRLGAVNDANRRKWNDQATKRVFQFKDTYSYFGKCVGVFLSLVFVLWHWALGLISAIAIVSEKVTGAPMRDYCSTVSSFLFHIFGNRRTNVCALANDL